MDLFYYANENNKPSHFECIAGLNYPDAVSNLKHQAFLSMSTLEGWCSPNKASLLIDFVLMAEPQVIVEIGVWGGKSLVPMAYALRENGFGKIYGIDPWSIEESIKGMDGINKEWWGSVNHQKIFDGLNQKIFQFGLKDQIVLIRKTSADADPIHNIGILHIDGNHSEEASYFDVTKWVPFVKTGGIIIFGDIYWGTTTKAVQWLDDNCIRIAEVRGENVWGVWIKP